MALWGHSVRIWLPTSPVGESGWDAPSAIGIVVIGLLYGEGDFGKSICIAVNCGEDTDCTAATVGSLLGIIGGIESIPQKWLEPIGESIKTCCVYTSDWVNFQIPKTVDELTERILTIVPEFLGWRVARFNTEEAGYTLTVLEADQLICHDQYINPWHNRNFHATLMESPFAVHYDFLLYKAVLDYGREPFIREDEKYTFILKLENVYQFPQWLTFRWHLPAGWTVTPGREVACSLESWYCANGSEQRTFTLTPHDLTQARYDIVLEITSQGHIQKDLFPLFCIPTAVKMLQQRRKLYEIAEEACEPDSHLCINSSDGFAGFIHCWLSGRGARRYDQCGERRSGSQG